MYFIKLAQGLWKKIIVYILGPESFKTTKCREFREFWVDSLKFIKAQNFISANLRKFRIKHFLMKAKIFFLQIRKGLC